VIVAHRELDWALSCSMFVSGTTHLVPGTKSEIARHLRLGPHDCGAESFSDVDPQNGGRLAIPAGVALVSDAGS